jgi:hypothetical protein
MKKLNTTYLDNLVSKVLKETLEERADSLVSKIKGDMCEQCGGNMNEGECNECGYTSGNMEEDIHDVEDINNENEFDYVEESDMSGYNQEDVVSTCKKHIKLFGEDDEVTQKLCQGVNLSESLKGGQRRLDKNKNNKLDAEDFKMLRQGKKFETKEGIGEYENIGADDFHERTGYQYWDYQKKDDLNSPEDKKDKKNIEFEDKYPFKEKKPSFFDRFWKKRDMEEQETQEGNAFSGALSKAKKEGKDSFEVDGKKYPVKESYRLTESEMISMIEKIVLEQKNTEVKDPAEKNNIKGMGGSPRGLEVYKKAHNGSGKENDDYIKSVTKKMKEYLKDGSKGEYEMNPKIFPVGNGELEKMDKKAFQMTDDLEDFNYEIAGLNLPTPDAIEFDEDFMEKLYKGDSKTGNAPGGNALESKANDRFNKLRKKNTLKKLKDQSYNRVSQPVFNEKSGTEKGKGINIKLESVEDKKTKQINEEFERIKSLIGYNQRTQ